MSQVITHSGMLSRIHILASLSDGKHDMKSLSIMIASCPGKRPKISLSGMSGWFSDKSQKCPGSCSSSSSIQK